MSGHVRVEPGEHHLVRVLWDRRESANSFDEALVEELIDKVGACSDASVLVLHGEGGRFSAGFDLRGEQADAGLAWRFGRAEHLLDLIRSTPAVTAALVTGPAFGLGADLVAACDYRVGDPSARFRFPGPRFGVVLGTDVLRARVGAARATDLLLRNLVVSAEAAHDDGLLTHVLATEEHERFVQQLAADVAPVDAAVRSALLAALRPEVRHASGARLLASTHVRGLAGRVAEYRAQALVKRDAAEPSR